MALQLRFVYAHRRLFHRESLFRDRTDPFDIYDERGLLDRYRFGKADLWKIGDEMLGDALEFNSTRLCGTPAIVQLLTSHDPPYLACVDSRSTRLRRWRDVTRQIRPVKSHGFPVSLTDFGNISRLTAGRH